MITGDRNWDDLDVIDSALQLILTAYSPTNYLVIHGGCQGADQMFASGASRMGFATRVFAPDWIQLGRAAGPIRNRQMIATNPVVIVVLHKNLHQSKGTKDCVNQVLSRMRLTPTWCPKLILNGQWVDWVTLYRLVHKLDKPAQLD